MLVLGRARGAGLRAEQTARPLAKLVARHLSGRSTAGICSRRFSLAWPCQRVSCYKQLSGRPGVFDNFFYHEAIAATLLLPVVNIIISWICDECIDLLCDTFSSSAWEGLAGFSEETSVSVKSKRAQFVYMTAGHGERPIMLRFRAALAAILTAILVPVQRNPTHSPIDGKSNKNVEPLFRIRRPHDCC